MSTGKPVVVYGASGYTGRLVCEYLREFNLPFVAAGRDKARIADAMSKVPGIDTIEHDIVEVGHDVGPLTELFDGASVVLNTVGPFAQLGGSVVEACLNAGCHYLDTTGEQDWLIVCDEKYGPRMAEQGLGGVFNRPLMLGVPQIVAAAVAQTEGCPRPTSCACSPSTPRR